MLYERASAAPKFLLEASLCSARVKFKWARISAKRKWTWRQNGHDPHAWSARPRPFGRGNFALYSLAIRPWASRPCWSGLPRARLPRRVIRRWFFFKLKYFCELKKLKGWRWFLRACNWNWLEHSRFYAMSPTDLGYGGAGAFPLDCPLVLSVRLVLKT